MSRPGRRVEWRCAKPGERMEAVSVRMTKEERMALALLARKRHLTISGMIRFLVREGVLNTRL